MNKTPEVESRDTIDRMLEPPGWVVVDRYTCRMSN